VRHLAELHEIPLRDAHVRFGNPGESLALYAREARAQTLVIGLSGAPRSARAPSEPLTERLIEALECDLLIVKTRYDHAAVGARPAPAVLPQSL
jgi:nucleotide-binding universal stress UspA family protein